jgi:hypothetical protein
MKYVKHVNHIDAFGLNTDNLRLIRLFFQPVLIFLALWSTGGWKYWKLWAKGKIKEQVLWLWKKLF